MPVKAIGLEQLLVPQYPISTHFIPQRSRSDPHLALFFYNYLFTFGARNPMSGRTSRTHADGIRSFPAADRVTSRTVRYPLSTDKVIFDCLSSPATRSAKQPRCSSINIRVISGNPPIEQLTTNAPGAAEPQPNEIEPNLTTNERQFLDRSDIGSSNRPQIDHGWHRWARMSGFRRGADLPIRQAHPFDKLRMTLSGAEWVRAPSPSTGSRP